MAQRRSAKKELKKSLRRKSKNITVKTKVKTTIKSFKKAIKDKDSSSAKKILPNIYEILDKAASKKIMHPNKAARKKSRLTKLLQRSA
jgi:small subunit ribosomal protein S20